MSDKNLAITPLMATVEFSWIDIDTQVKHVVALLQKDGDTALNIVTGLLKLVKLATMRDMLGVFAELNAVTVDVRKLIDAVKAEFDI